MSGLVHALCRHGGDDDLTDRLAGTVLDALAAGGSVATLLRPVTEVALRGRVAEALGADAVAGLLRLRRDCGPDGPSGQTEAARLARVLRARHRGVAGPVTVVVEHSADLDDPRGAYWGEVEAAAALALADLPLRLLCFFPADLPGPVAEVVRRAHPFVLDDGRPVPTGVDADPRRLLDGLGAPVPAELGAPAREFRFDATQLRDVRRAVDEALRGQGFPDSRAEDVTVAVNEVATNAVHHGTHTARLMLWTPEQDVVCEVHDGGRLADPLPGLAPPDPGRAHGRGIWIARQLCDLLHVWGDDTGTHVRIRAAA